MRMQKYSDYSEIDSGLRDSIRLARKESLLHQRKMLRVVVARYREELVCDERVDGESWNNTSISPEELQKTKYTEKIEFSWLLSIISGEYRTYFCETKSTKSLSESSMLHFGMCIPLDFLNHKNSLRSNSLWFYTEIHVDTYSKFA